MNIFKKTTILSLFSSLFFLSCETTEMDLITDPNNLNTDQTSIPFLLRTINLSHANFVHRSGEITSDVMRQTNMNGFQYQNAFSPTSFNGLWENAYRNVLKNSQIISDKSIQESGFERYVVISKLLSANVLVTLVDLFGNVPYSEALSETNLSPKLDNGADVYAAALQTIDEAIAIIDSGAGVSITSSADDAYYGGDMTKWKKMANTLKMKIYYQTRLVDASAVSKFEAIVSSGNYINTNDDNFVFEWGSNLLNPNSRHPWYNAGYGPGGIPSINFYMSNYLMDLMRNKYSVADPRMAYYFYRQVGSYNTSSAAIISSLPCLNQTVPAHYPSDMVFCRLSNGHTEGWWGRDHGNQDGVPPDGTRRTRCGIYPAGGRTDDKTFEYLNGQNFGAQGNGVTPIILNSSVNFWRAEMTFFGGTGDFNTHLSNGISSSIAYVSSFLGRDKGTVLTANLPTPTQSAAYLSDINTRLIAATTTQERMELWGEQYLISTYGNGLDAYAAYRRTGYPKNIQMNLEPNPGPFMRTFWYPDNSTSTNNNVSQKPNLTIQTFWDNNPLTGFLQNN